MGDGPPGFAQGSTCPVLLGYPLREANWFSPTGLSPALVSLSSRLRVTIGFVTPWCRCNGPQRNPQPPTYNTCAATEEIAIAFSSCGYLDVSVPRVRLTRLCIHRAMSRKSATGCPIQESPINNACLAAHRSLSQPSYAFHRLSEPRHPPYALTSLTPFSSFSFQITLLTMEISGIEPPTSALQGRRSPN